MKGKGDITRVNMSFDLISHVFFFWNPTREEQPEQKSNMQMNQNEWLRHCLGELKIGIFLVKWEEEVWGKGAHINIQEAWEGQCQDTGLWEGYQKDKM